MFVLSAPFNLLVQRFHNLDLKDLGLKGLSMSNGRKPQSCGARRLENVMLDHLERYFDIGLVYHDFYAGARQTLVRGNHLSSATAATCLTHGFLKRGEECSKL